MDKTQRWWEGELIKGTNFRYTFWAPLAILVTQFIAIAIYVYQTHSISVDFLLVIGFLGVLANMERRWKYWR